MHVDGTIGRVQSFDSIIGNVNNAQSPTAQKTVTTNLQETEVKTVGAATVERGDFELLAAAGVLQ